MSTGGVLTGHEGTDTVMEDARDLAEIKHKLRAVVNVKGD